MVQDELMHRLRAQQKGFTLVELLIAMTIFSMMLTICAVVFLGINRLYFKGIAVTNAQTATRNTVDDLARHLRTQSVSPSDQTYSGAPSEHYFCLGDDVYYYQLGKVVDAATKHVFAQWNQPGYCAAPPAAETFTAGTPAGDAKEVVSGSVSIHYFHIDATRISIITAYGPLSSLKITPDPAVPPNPAKIQVNCADGVDSRVCGVSHLDVVVTSRTQKG